ncbi:hypothetical protein O988_04574 [Pseudogymnoascus sp. VKM F-3808]|nr:hypothetical protein O988_04574 [Pseudogymnoascus sp. VKM F-3808]
MKRTFRAGEDGHTDESQSHKKRHLTRFSEQKAGLDNDDQKQEGEKGRSEKEDMRLSNGGLAANRMLSQDKIPEPKGSVKEEEDGGRESTCQHQATLLSLPYEIRKMIWELVL